MAETLPVIVINLPDSRERRDYMREQSNQLGFLPEFFPAVDGRQPHPLFNRVDVAGRLRFKGKAFTLGERGCWASHFLVWQKCVALDKPVIVLEDDAELCENFADFLQGAAILAEKVPYARLYLGEAPSRQIGTVGKYQIHLHRRTPFGAVAYLLTPQAAQCFLAHADSWLLPVDDYMDLSWKHGVELLAIAPPVVALRQAFTSTVQQDITKPRLALRTKLMRELFRSYMKLRHFLHYLHYLYFKRKSLFTGK